MNIKFQVTALVPMKGVSVRVKGKNLRPFGDRPLCAHILGALQNCEAIGAIVVNTDSDEIAALASAFSKTRVHERPEHLQGHDVPMNDIIKWDLDHDSTGAEHFLQTHATNPLLTEKTILAALEAYFSQLDEFDSLFSVTPLQSRFYSEKLEPINHDPAQLLKTQDLPPIYEENSCLYIFSSQSFSRADNRRIGLRPQKFAMNKLEAMDIDTEDEFAIAQAVWHMNQG